MLKISYIARIIQGQRIQQFSNTAIHALLLDSRKQHVPSNALFFAIIGNNYDGHDFLDDLYEKGVRNFVVSKIIDVDKYPEANIIMVSNTVIALQKLAQQHRFKYNQLQVVGVTGSNGKTIVKEWLYQLLWQDYTIVRSPKSFNSQVGVPLSIWKIDKSHNLGIFEAGISKVGEMRRLEDIIKPSIGIFTNIGAAHSEGFAHIMQKTQEKLKLFAFSERLLYCADYTVITKSIAELRKENPVKYRFETLTWTRKSLPSAEVNLHITGVEKHQSQTFIKGLYKGKPHATVIPFTDEASVENAIHCWLLLLYWGYNDAVIFERMRKLSPVAMRLELKAGINNCTIINDSYNSDLSALSIALDFLDQQQQHPNKTVILSDILESGVDEQQLYRKVGKLLLQHNVNTFIGIGNNLSKYPQFFNQNSTQFFDSTAAFLNANLRFQDEAILVKGARTFAFERVAQYVSHKAHSTVLEINLNALAHNLQVYKKRLKASTKIMVMVKALAYGNGTFEVANVLQYNNVDYLSVAYTDEAVDLRKAGIQLPIMVMNPEPTTFDDIVRYKLEPEIYSLSHLKKFEQYLKSSFLNPNFPFPIHINIDTGMHRLGFEIHELRNLLLALKNNPYFKIQSVFTHLAASDSPEHNAFTQQQLHQFGEVVQRLRKHFSEPFLAHALNTAGIVHFAEQGQFDMVRLGLGVYGIDTSSAIQQELRTVSTLKTYVSQVKRLNKPQTVGYGRMGQLQEATTIATVSIGYGDGLSRLLSNGRGKMLVNGVFAPIIGNVCMDMCMLNVSHIPHVQAGDEVIVFGDLQPVQELANTLQTIPYEILTGIADRVKRVYYKE